MESRPRKRLAPLPALMFMSRWLQLPLYFGNVAVLKVKLAAAIIGISSIHRLTTFIRAGSLSGKQTPWQTIIQVTFPLSALAIAGIERILPPIARYGLRGR